MLDVLSAATGLVLLGPALLLVAAAVKTADGGPVLFRQPRLGRRGRSFPILKFRTMVVNAENQGDKLRSARNDPRITPLGRYLREYHVDEIPQLFNVLRGEMSLVGPRPALPFHKDYYQPWEMDRLSVRPGLTGLPQVSGGNALNWDQRIVLDVWYVRNRNLRMVVSILWRTFAQLFVKKGVYRDDGAVRGWTRPVPDWYHDDTAP